MSLVQYIAVGFVAVGSVILVVLLVRQQLSRDRDMSKLFKLFDGFIEQHERVLEHLMIASDPDAWRVKHVEELRAKRHAERAKNRQAPEKQPEMRGVS